MAAWTPVVYPMNVVEQGGRVFPNVSHWNDAMVMVASTENVYDLAAFRSAAGLEASQPLFIIFGADVAFWANFSGGAAAIPSADVDDGSSAEFSPNQRYVDGTVTQISFISADAGHISMAIYKP